MRLRFSYEAVAALRTRGLTVPRLQDGLPECRAAGLPVKAGAVDPAIRVQPLA